MRQILIVGGGYAGFYTAWQLERGLRSEEAAVTLVDPRPYMTYQPFLPEVAAGSIEARHAAVAHRRHLRRTRLIAGTVTRIDHRHRQVRVARYDGTERVLDYDIVVVTAGAVTRTLPIPGLAEQAIGFKHVEEAVAVRDRLLTSFDRAVAAGPGPERNRLLTVTVVGGGFTGIEVLGELLSLATDLVRRYPELDPDDLAFHLVEARSLVLPEVSDRPGRWVVRSLRERGAQVHLDSRLLSARDGQIELSTGERFASDLIIWTAGNAAAPVVAQHTDLPVTERGLVRVRPDLRVGTDADPVDDAWAAGDNAAVPDLAAAEPGRSTVPNAQHAVRQGRWLARNIRAHLRGRPLRPYRHRSIGVVATLGLGRGIFEYHRLVIKGFPAWLMHRGYHVLAVPSWERKIRVLAGWVPAMIFGRDLVSLADVERPRDAFIAADKAARSG